MVSVLITVLMFLLMISLHEFGHFISGKLLGFNVLEYSIGFGPVIFKKQGKKTLYSVRIIPFGGFCKFDGEDETDSGNEGSFNKQPCWKRLIVLSAGAFFNILLGFIIYIFLTSSTGVFYTNTIDKVIEHTALYDSGVQSGDEIVSVNGHGILGYKDIRLYTIDLQEGKEFELGIKRNGEKKTVMITPTVQKLYAEYREDCIYYKEEIGGYPTEMYIPYDESRPYRADIVGKTEEAYNLLIGYSPVIEEVTYKNIIPATFSETCFAVKYVYYSLFQLITGKIGMSEVSGPVGVATVVNEAVESGATKKESAMNVFSLIALLTINLGVLNLLPLPALDGGRILFVLIEMIRRKPIPKEKEGLVHGIGFAILFAFMLFVLMQDIVKLIK